MPSEFAIQIQGIVKRFPKFRRYREMLLRPFTREWVTALQDVSLQVPRGELFGLIGPNGAGKTTLIKVLCTLMLPNAGRAEVNGCDLYTRSRDVRRSIGYVVNDERSFFWRLTGRQNLDFFAALNNFSPTQARQRIGEVLGLTGMVEHEGKLFKDYSTGMRQRLAIARGLLARPEILFMDEPTRSLDPTAAEQLRRFVRRELVQSQGKTVFFSTHNLAEAQGCDRLAILHRGHIRACGTLPEILRLNHNRRYVIQLGQNNLDYKQLLQPLSFTKFISASANGHGHLEVEINTTQGNVSQLIERLVLAGGKVETCQPAGEELGEVFQQLTGENSHEF